MLAKSGDRLDKPTISQSCCFERYRTRLRPITPKARIFCSKRYSARSRCASIALWRLLQTMLLEAQGYFTEMGPTLHVLQRLSCFLKGKHSVNNRFEIMQSDRPVHRLKHNATAHVDALYSNTFV